MRKPIILALICLVAFVAVLAFVGGGPVVDKKHPDPNVHAPAWMALLGALTSPFAPNAVLPQTRLTVPPGPGIGVAVPKSTDEVRIARFEIAGPGAVKIVYQCQGSNADDCRQVACLGGTPGPALPVASDCSKPNNCWRQDVAVRIYPGGGSITFVATGAAAVVEQVKRSTKAAGSNCG